MFGNISKDFSVDNIKKLDYMDMCMIFCDYDSIDDDYILYIHKYLIKKKNMK